MLDGALRVNPLLEQPLWRTEDLGKPLPDSPHAVSMSLPIWDHVVGYEEKRPEITARLRTGYPRFVIHPYVLELAGRLAGGQPCLPFPSSRAAELCAEFVRSNGAPARVIPGHGVFGVATDENATLLVKAFWQHTGLIVSTRQAQACQEARPEPRHSDEVRRSLRRQLAALYGCGEDDVFLGPTGMAAQFEALQAVMALAPKRPTIQLGFPYVDTLKLQQKLGHGGILLHDLEHIETQLRVELDKQAVAACFSEIPGNPLLGSSDLRRISPLLRDRGIPLVADDVVATPINVDLSPYADLVATSLTKFVVGTGEAMGGALICHPGSPLYSKLKPIVKAQHEELLWGEDAEVLDSQARTFPERMRQHNRNGLLIAERLRAHPAIEQVWYPKWEFSDAYEAVRRPDGGYGALITFLPRRAEVTSPQIYDRLRFCKGPSLGTVFSLACPFTLLAHYTELQWAEDCGVSRFLIRLSIGLEDPEELWSRLNEALG